MGFDGREKFIAKIFRSSLAVVVAAGVLTIAVVMVPTSVLADAQGLPTVQATDAVPGPVTELQKHTVGDQTITVSWTAPTLPEGSSDITSYEAQIREVSSFVASDTQTHEWRDAESVNMTDLTARFAGVANLTHYDVQVRAVNDAGEGEWASVRAGHITPFAKYTGIWQNDTTMWMVTLGGFRGGVRVYSRIEAFDLATGARSPSDDFNMLDDEGNGWPYSLASDGETMWVADNFDSRVYAYDMITKQRVESKEINTAAHGNS